ncbi:hypothetical protein EGW08_009425, partial [Elysia chlorotica]
MFSVSAGGRTQAADILIVMTDGRSQDTQRTLQSAQALKQQGVWIIAIGIADATDEELYGMASSPSDVFKSPNFDTLQNILDKVNARMCQVTKQQPACKTSTYGCCPDGTAFAQGPNGEGCTADQCAAQADIILVMDSSASIQPTEYAKELDFAAKIIDDFKIGPNDVRFAAIVFGSSPTKLFNLADHNSPQTLQEAIKRAPFLNSGTKTNKALEMITQDQMFSSRWGGRDFAKDIVIIITDGRSTYASWTQLAANRLKASNVTIISVGIGADVDQRELRGLASKPDDVLLASNFDSLKDIQDDVGKRTCE